jgi:hypothetical protein
VIGQETHLIESDPTEGFLFTEILGPHHAAGELGCRFTRSAKVLRPRSDFGKPG